VIAISGMARGIGSSPIRKMFNIASAMSDIVNFSIGEPDFVTPSNIIGAAEAALSEGWTHYAPNAGILPLRRAISQSIRRSHSLEVDPEEEVIVTAGGMEALMLAMLALVDAGDEVILGDPYWPNYIGQIRMCGGVPVFAKAGEGNGFLIDADEVRRAISPKTKILLINSPTNPTGAVADRGTLRALADLAIERDLIVISDEVYRRFLYEGAEFTSISAFPGMKERTVLVDSFSKTYAMTGWRVGWAVGPREAIRSMVKLQENVMGCVNTAAQFAAIEAISGSHDALEAMVAEYAERRELLLGMIAGQDRLSCVAPRGAFYSFVNIKGSGLSSEDFAMRLLTEKSVAVVPGSGFGEEGEGFVRISYATSKARITEGFARIARFMSELPGT
jgi:aminotransferase